MTTMIATADCIICGQRADDPQDTMVLYIHPDPTSTARSVGHARCIADEIDAGRAVRTSAFAARRVEP